LVKIIALSFSSTLHNNRLQFKLLGVLGEEDYIEVLLLMAVLLCIRCFAPIKSKVIKRVVD